MIGHQTERRTLITAGSISEQSVVLDQCRIHMSHSFLATTHHPRIGMRKQKLMPLSHVPKHMKDASNRETSVNPQHTR